MVNDIIQLKLSIHNFDRGLVDRNSVDRNCVLSLDRNYVNHLTEFHLTELPNLT
jgi:hypothetical protein